MESLTLSILACALTLNGKRYPFIVLFIILMILVYQLASGKLLNLYWRTLVLRKERPRMWWTVFGIEFALALLLIYLGTS